MDFPQHSRLVLEQLNQQRQLGLLCDCTFVVDGIDFKAHKAVLAACSEYFRMLFVEQKDVVHLDISNAAGLGQVLEFVYTAKLNVTLENMEDVLTVASFLQMQEIVSACNALKPLSVPAESCTENQEAPTTADVNKRPAEEIKTPIEETATSSELDKVEEVPSSEQEQEKVETEGDAKESDEQEAVEERGTEKSDPTASTTAPALILLAFLLYEQETLCRMTSLKHPASIQE